MCDRRCWILTLNRETSIKGSIKALKVKIKSLAAEARIIRLEERRASKRRIIRPAVSPTKIWTYPGNNKLREYLRDHRVGVVRSEARHSLLAYGFLRGRPYAALEKRPPTGYRSGKAWVEPDWEKVRAMVAKYGESLTMIKESLAAWRKGELPAKV